MNVSDMAPTEETKAQAPQRARTAIVVGVGQAMEDEWETARVPQALRRLAEAARPYAPSGGALSVVYFGSRIKLAEPTTLDDFERDGVIERPDCGPGANLTAAIHGALSQREGDERLHVYVVSDCKVDPDELERTKHVIAHSRNIVVMLIRVSTDADGIRTACELDEFQTGNDDNVSLVHYNDGRGRDVGANLEAHVSNRMSVLLSRHYVTSV